MQSQIFARNPALNGIDDPPPPYGPKERQNLGHFCGFSEKSGVGVATPSKEWGGPGAAH